MSRGFSTGAVPILVSKGVERAFDEWESMSGEWLRTAPEYFVTVKVAQYLRKVIPASQRTLLMEPEVSTVLKDAGGVQCGPKAKHLRIGGRFDVVLGRGDGRPRVVIELKNGVYLQMGDGVKADLHRLCHALLHGKQQTHLHAGILAMFTSRRPPRTHSDATARAYLERRWLTEYRPLLKAWKWAGRNRAKYRKQLEIDVGIRLHDREFDGQMHAWAVVVVRIRRKTPAAKVKQSTGRK
jgi:hypothetical protein